MPSQIILRDTPNFSDPEGNLNLRLENTGGTPINAVARLENGEQHPGVYNLAFSGAPVSAVDIVPDSSKNPYAGTAIPIVMDGATLNITQLPGVSIVGSATASAGDTAIIVIGDFLDAVLDTTSPRLNHGIVTAGSLSVQRRISFVNVGTEDGADCTIAANPGFYIDGADAEKFIGGLNNHFDVTLENAAVVGNLDLTFENRNFVSGFWEHDVRAGGVLAILGAKADGSTPYFFGDGHGYIDGNDALPGRRIVFLNTTYDPTSDTYTIHTRAGHEIVEFSLDSGGSPDGTWVSGPLTMTEDLEISGVVTVGGQDIFWVRYNVPSVELPGDQRLVKFRARSKTI